ncbi:hypothetical protein AAMO2058_001313200 [Amorphochlora amoebiformis]|uniref:Transcription initiation factor IIA subunit 2 n=1 Tax=Amorphochlora amoebiformis TaxID=1561963 RepID=A0A7S0DCL2_9EUKA|mmetsp:Transcript_23351/g.36688  ORF Transcript_23351/g.36688 Transcript_23351/m.36688 type:complete len:117 (+) Transcript_23351:63-413(+)
MSNNYRATTIGKALREALQDMLDSEDLSAEDANKFFEYFDEGMTKKLIELKPNPKKKKVQLKSRLHSYNFVDNCWNFHLEKVEIKDLRDITDAKNETLTVDRLKVTAVDAKVHKKS